jgi:hypothetical protein
MELVNWFSCNRLKLFAYSFNCWLVGHWLFGHHGFLLSSSVDDEEGG